MSHAHDRSYPDQALVVIEAMAARWGSAPALLGFGLLNEPLVCSMFVLSSLASVIDDLSLNVVTITAPIIIEDFALACISTLHPQQYLRTACCTCLWSWLYITTPVWPP